jgi:hypothetical protein
VAVTPAIAPKPTVPPLDLAGLEARLRDTRAIGVFTKLSLKNQVDDLLNQFRAFYRRQAKTTLAELRRPYDMLLLKVLSLLQDSDPPLARDIVASREAIWAILADPQKFTEARLMAGETTCTEVPEPMPEPKPGSAAQPSWWSPQCCTAGHCAGRRTPLSTFRSRRT